MADASRIKSVDVHGIQAGPEFDKQVFMIEKGGSGRGFRKFSTESTLFYD